MSPIKIKEKLRRLALQSGAKMFGFCRLGNLTESFHFEIRQQSQKLPFAVSLGMPVSAEVLNTIIDRPNHIYKAHYQQINHLLNDAAYLIASEIEEHGFKALPIPASQIIKWKPLKAHLSHREIAYKAGLGWWGKNNLLINEKYGARVRLVTILTDIELPVDKPVEILCEECEACKKACPAGAIKDCREDFDLKACYKQVAEFARPENIGSYICGLCLKACHGKKSK